MLDTEDLRCVPGIATNTPQPVQVILVEDLGRAHSKTHKLSDFGRCVCICLKPDPHTVHGFKKYGHLNYELEKKPIYIYGKAQK